MLEAATRSIAAILFTAIVSGFCAATTETAEFESVACAWEEVVDRAYRAARPAAGQIFAAPIAPRWHPEGAPPLGRHGSEHRARNGIGRPLNL